MCTKLFLRLSYLVCLFQNPCFAAFQTASSNSTNVDNLSNKNHAICTIHSGELEIEQKNLGNELLVCGFIREFEPKVTNKIIPNCIMSLCVDFSRRLLPCHCIKKKYRKILPKLDNKEDRKKVIELLLCYKIEEEKDKLGTTIFHRACEGGHLGLAKLLKERDANIHTKDRNGDNALHHACAISGSTDVVTWLLDECKISLESKGYEQTIPFLYAAGGGQLEIVKLLKERGANIHAKDEKGSNALHFACLFSDSVEMVTWLLDVCKIGIETKSEYYQRTPFLFAAEKGQLAIAKLLRQRGANINAKDEWERNALHMACFFSGSVDMVTWLLDVCSISLETKGYKQMTPFLYAAEKGQLNVAKLLKERGANTKAKDKNGCNALRLAKKNNRQEMILYLESQSRIKTGRCLNFWFRWF